MTDEHTFPMRESAPTGSPTSYDRESIEELLKSSEPGEVTESGHAYLRLSQAYQRITQRLAQVGHDLNEAWSGTDAAAAQEQMRDLWASSHTISATARDFGTAIERHGSEYLAWYKNSMPQPKTEAEARSWMQGANERITQTWTSLPPDISTQLPNNLIMHGAPIAPGGSGGGAVSGIPVGQGGSTGSGGASELSSSHTPTSVPGGTGPGIGAPPSTSPHSGGATLVPSPGIGSSNDGQPHVPKSASGGGEAGDGGTDLSGVLPTTNDGVGESNPSPSARPASPSVPPLDPNTAAPGLVEPGSPGLGLPGASAFGQPGRPGLGLPGRTALGLTGSRAGFPQSLPDSGTGGLDRNGVIGRNRLGPPPPLEAGAPAEVPAPRTGPMAMSPMTGAGGSPRGERERERSSWLREDPEVWEENMQVAPSVLGSEPGRPQSRQGE
ncbi:WXG100 family type VII secretion target [Actinomadura montaniterrae]|uniref:WXG100 family type VII secretion target n=1 Tax=Actinomadura montaniterrae TaxID=1803903 RepID=UPI00178C323D|nr:hypothetical protein [Actinomadura montaniterrae]